MGIGASILLLAVGAVLAFAVKATTIMGVQVHVVGYILMAAGVLGLIWSLIVLSTARRRVAGTPVDTAVETAAPVVVHRHVVTEDDAEHRPGSV
jgi:cytochrome b